ncbi:RNA polymerase sigma factor [Actinoallomurus sp. CA-150999]|uniref:RNA polymerase sigma factor n=1 Tax=Actinoallomurus sp. CA-150999 TaxID=3239887 RepID=UPI003D908C0C
MRHQKLAIVDDRVDGELVRLAQSGDVSGFEQLFARHRAGMMAVALSLLGDPAEAEDAVQDAMLTALSRIGDVRNPDSVGPWLKAIVRNCCRMWLRAPTPIPVADMAAVSKLEYGDPAELVEHHVARDWVWHALERLSPPLRLVTMLRYFTEVKSYEQIASVCGVPVGTVRSRLSKAREKLSHELRAASSSSHDDVAALTAARRREAEGALIAGAQARFGEFLRETWHPDVETLWADGNRTRGIAPLVQVVDTAMEAGVQQRLASVVASREIVIWELDVRNPVDDLGHCPTRPCWLLFIEDGRVRRFRHFAGQPLTA